MAEPETEGTDLSVRAAEVVADVTETDRPQERGRVVSTFIKAASSGARVASSGARVATSGARAVGRGTRVVQRRASEGTGWLADQVVAMAPRLRVRDRAALQVQFPGKSPDEIADALIESAARAAAAAGGAVGMASALVAELHEAYGSPAPGKFPERMSAYVGAWAHRRGVFMIEGGLIFAAGSPLARLLRRRLVARAGRSAFSLGPMLTGAAAGALFNRRETRKLGRDIQRDLRRRALEPPAGPWWQR